MSLTLKTSQYFQAPTLLKVLVLDLQIKSSAYIGNMFLLFEP